MMFSCVLLRHPPTSKTAPLAAQLRVEAAFANRLGRLEWGGEGTGAHFSPDVLAGPRDAFFLESLLREDAARGIADSGFGGCYGFAPVGAFGTSLQVGVNYVLKPKVHGHGNPRRVVSHRGMCVRFGKPKRLKSSRLLNNYRELFTLYFWWAIQAIS
jgi:hypothetical protein